MGQIREGKLRRGARAEAKRAVKRSVGERGPDKGLRHTPMEAMRLRAKGYATASEVAQAEGVAFTTVRRRIRDELIPGRALEAISQLTTAKKPNKHWYVHLPKYFALLIAKDHPSRGPIRLLAQKLGIKLDLGKPPVMDLG